MEYRIDRQQLGNDPLYETLTALQQVLSSMGLSLYVVGAGARDIAMKLLGAQASTRLTTDVDIAIALDNWEMFGKVSLKLQDNHFIKDPYAKQRFYYIGNSGSNDYEVDIVPFGPLASNEVVGWPPDGDPEMSVRCFDDVMRVADTIILDNDVSFRIASLSGQFLIKLDTWMDRHLKTDKDAFDMYHIMDNFYVVSIVGKYPPPVQVTDGDSQSFEPLVAGAQWIASELRILLSDKHKCYYTEFLQKELDAEDNSVLVQHLVAASRDSRVQSYLRIRQALQNIHNILSE